MPPDPPRFPLLPVPPPPQYPFASDGLANFFHCSTTRMDEDTRLHNSEWLIPVNQSTHLTKDRFAWIILNYVILSALDVNNIFWL